MMMVLIKVAIVKIREMTKARLRAYKTNTIDTSREADEVANNKFGTIQVPCGIWSKVTTD
jgi:hypothetical protein